jgi:hypothetical protein
MTQHAPRVHIEADAIDRLKALQLQLGGEIVAELHLRSGEVIVATVPERPTVQQFLDADGNEGTNGMVRLDTGDAGVHLIWLDEVDHVVRLGSC